MAILDFLTGRQQPMGGVVGMVAQPQAQAQRGIIGDPAFAQSLTRLGANLMAAGAQTDNTLGAIGTALGATLDQNMQARRQQAEIDALTARSAPQGEMQATPFGGTGYQNQILASRYQFHVANGDNDLVARQKAINDFYALNPVTGVDAEGRPFTTPRAALPTEMGVTAPVAPATMPAAAQDPIDQTAAALGLPTGALLPPPSGTQPTGAMPTQGVLTAPRADVLAQTGMPRGNLIQAPAAPGPKTAQALAEEAGKAEIGVQGKFAEQLADIEANRLKGLREQASTLNARAPDMERLALAIQRYGDTGTLGDLRLTMNKIGADFGVANPDRVAEGELIKQIVSKMTPTMRPEGSGAASDADMRLFMDSLPNLFTSGPGAAKGYQYFERVRQYQNAIANEAENFAYNNRTMRGFNEHLEKLKKDGVISLWTPEERSQLQAIAKGTSTQNAGLPQPTTKAEFDKLPSGAQFLDPNGVLRRKP